MATIDYRKLFVYVPIPDDVNPTTLYSTIQSASTSSWKWFIIPSFTYDSQNYPAAIYVRGQKISSGTGAADVQILTQRINDLIAAVGVSQLPDGGTTLSAAISSIEDAIGVEKNPAEGTIRKRLLDLEEKTIQIDDEDLILSNGEDGLKTTLGLNYVSATGSTNAKLQLIGIGSSVVSEIDASDFIKDGMLESATYNSSTHKITLTWNTDKDGDGEKDTTEIDVSDLVDTYIVKDDSEDYLDISNYEVQVKIDNIISAVVSSLSTRLTDIEDRLTTAETGIETNATSINNINSMLGDAFIIENNKINLLHSVWQSYTAEDTDTWTPS